jgi:hypothetical protein
MFYTFLSSLFTRLLLCRLLGPLCSSSVERADSSELLGSPSS